MWSPTATHILPSQKDKERICASILPLELQLEMAKDELVKAKRRVDDLQDRILQRRAWLAPIRYLPTEVLSMVFVLYCREKWDGPLDIQRVCKHWKNVVRATPEVWNFVPWDVVNKNPGLKGLIPLFSKRSRHQQRHIWPQSPSEPDLEVLLNPEESNVICITDKHGSTVATSDIPSLRTLRLRWEEVHSRAADAPTDLCTVLNNTRFPNLRTFSLILYDTPLFTPHEAMPPLQNLEISGVAPFEVVDLLKCCARYLSVLILHFVSPEVLGQPVTIIDSSSVHFPRLHSVYLTYIYTNPGSFEKVMDASAPLLKTYIHRGGVSAAPIHFDTKDAINLELDGDVNLAYHARVETLGISSSTNAVTELQNTGICPRLATLVITGSPTKGEMKEITDGLKGRKTWTEGPVNVVRHNSFAFSRFILPFFQCPDGYSCHQRWARRDWNGQLYEDRVEKHENDEKENEDDI